MLASPSLSQTLPSLVFSAFQKPVSVFEHPCFSAHLQKILIKVIQTILFLLIKAKLVHSAFEKCHTRGLSFK